MRGETTDSTTLDGKQRNVPSPIAAAAERQLHTLLPLIQRLHLLVELYDFVLPTGDNVSTVAPHFLRWMADPALDVTDVGRRHLAQALAHEAFHAAGAWLVSRTYRRCVDGRPTWPPDLHRDAYG